MKILHDIEGIQCIIVWILISKLSLFNLLYLTINMSFDYFMYKKKKQNIY